MITKPLTSDIKGILWMLHYGFWFSVIGILTRYLSMEPFNLHPFQIVFFHNVIALFCIVLWYRRSPIPKASKTEHILVGLRSVLFFIAMLCWFYALTAMPINDAVALSFTNPLFTTIAAMIFLKEKVHIRRWCALIIGFIGVLIILQPGSGIFNPTSLIVLVTTCFWALSNSATKKLSYTMSVSDLLPYTIFLFVPLSLPFAWMVWKEVPLAAWWLLGLMGFFAAIADISMLKAFKHADVSVIMPFGFIRLIVTAILAWICFQETLSIWTGVGAAIIFTSSIYIAHREYKQKIKRPPPI